MESVRHITGPGRLIRWAVCLGVLVLLVALVLLGAFGKVSEIREVVRIQRVTTPLPPLTFSREPVTAQDCPPEGRRFVVLGDTQAAFENGSISQVRAQIDYVNRLEVAAVLQVGDFVSAPVREQFQAMRSEFDRLKHPWGAAIGNHDFKKTGNEWDTRLWRKYVGGVYRNEFFEDVFVHFLPCDATKLQLEEMDRSVKSAALRGLPAIVVTHRFLGVVKLPQTTQERYHGPSGLMEWTKMWGKDGTSADRIWQDHLSKHPNLAAVICGDQGYLRNMRMQLRGDHGNVVWAFMFDYGGYGPKSMVHILDLYSDRIVVDSIDASTGRRLLGEAHSFTVFR